eukprot:8706177-Heterocapsa_arctica.AAC.1
MRRGPAEDAPDLSRDTGGQSGARVRRSRYSRDLCPLPALGEPERPEGGGRRALRQWRRARE